MPVPGKLKIELNHAQRRVDRPRLNVALVAADWDSGYDADPLALDAWRVPGCGALAIKPTCLGPEWKEESAGLYAKLGLADFDGIGTGGGWRESKISAGARRLTKIGGPDMAVPAVSKVAVGRNQGIYLSSFCFDIPTGANPQIDAEVGWSNAGNGLSGVSVRWWSDGRIEVWKDGDRRATYPEGAAAGGQASSRSGKWANWVLLPMRGRELLLYDDVSGESFVHVFTELSPDETEATNLITDAAKIWFYKPVGDVDVEIAPLRFPPSSRIVMRPYAFGRRPLAGQTLARFQNLAPFQALEFGKVLGHGQGYAGEACTDLAVRREDGTTAFTAGDPGKIRLVATLVSDSGGRYTPTLYGLQASWSNRTTMTDASEIADVTPDARLARLEVPDDPLGVNLEAALRYSDLVRDTGVALHDCVPARVSLGSTVILDGYAEAVSLTDSINPDARVLTIRIRDGVSAMERMQYRDRFPLDWYVLSRPYTSETPSAVSTLFRSVAIEDLQLADEDHRVGAVPPKDGGSFSHPVTEGSSPAKEMGTLVDSFAYGTLWGQKPTPDGIRGFFRPPHPASRPADLTVYARVEDAIAAEMPASQIWSGYEVDALPIEANEVRVQGIDPQTGEVVSAWDEDAASKDPETAPSERPDNWAGEDRVVGFQSPRLTRRADCVRLVEKTMPVVSAKRFACSWNGGLLLFPGTDVPLWRGDVVDLDGKRTGVPIASFVASFVYEGGDLVFREASYVGGACLGKGGRRRRDQRDRIEDSIALGARTFGFGSGFVSSDLGPGS